MLNHYPLWKYFILLLMLVGGLIYSLPNLYGEDPAIQVTGKQEALASESILIQIQNILKQQKIRTKSICLKNGVILASFSSQEVQLRAHEILLHALDENYIVTLNLISATPAWLKMIGAAPIKLGLDLRGGVHFLMEVDMHTVFNTLQEQCINTLCSDLHEQKISYEILKNIKNYGSEIRFRDAAIRDQAIAYLAPQHRELILNRNDNNGLYATPTDDHLRKTLEYAVEQNIIILRKRVNQLGVTEPLVQRQGTDRIVIELPGIQDTARAKKILGTTATLEFRLINNTLDPRAIANGQVPEDSEVKATSDSQSVVLYKQAILTGNHITDSTFGFDEYNRPQVNISLDSRGTSTMLNFTKYNIGKLLATLFVEYKDTGKQDTDGRAILVKQEEVINIATIQSQFGHTFRITGISNPKEARQLALLLRAGALIAPTQILEERIIGPTLGMKNITQGIKACVWGLLASILFMVICYRKFGMIAATALIVNLILIIAIMSLLPGVTLTMPGIAGIILTLAVSVDANVLINERIKEELRNGRSIQQAIYEGYRGAFSSIADANITTLITTIILYTIGTSSIKGFAITIAIGVGTSMFTAIVGTRAIVNLIYGGKRINKLPI